METYIKVQNCYSWLKTENSFINNKIWNGLRFKEKNFWHNPYYKKGLWDGYKEFYSNKTGRFPTGLYPEILAALKMYKIPYKIIDERSAPKWQFNSIDENFLNNYLKEGMQPVTLHDYQVDFVNQALKHDRGIIQAPTSSGKTFVLISILKCLPPGTPALFLTKNCGLIDQNYNDMKLWGVENLGRYYGGYKEFNRVMCVNTHQDSIKAIEKLLPHFKALIVDEVHECMSDVPTKAYDKMKSAAIRFGISATPFKYTKRKDNGKEECKDKVHKYKVKGYFGGVYKTNTTESGYLTTKYLQERGILSRSICTFYPIRHPTNIEYEPYTDAVTLGISNNFEFLKIIKRLALTLKGRTLILVERIDQGEYLKQLLPNSHWIKGSDDLDERFKVFTELKFGENVIAIAMRHIITAGINVFLHNLINASGGQAEHSVIQQMGRGLRCATDKECLEYYDFIFHTNKYLFDHSNNRVDILGGEGHKIIVKNDIDF